VWLASDLLSFDSYGIAPHALPRQGLPFGPAPFGPPRMPMSPGPMPTGGLAVFRVRLLPIFGASRTAVLQVNCALADVPHERSVEGIRLSLEKNGSEFFEEVGGRVMFLSMRPQGAPVKATEQEAAPEVSEKPQK
jgi:hypothetical protein